MKKVFIIIFIISCNLTNVYSQKKMVPMASLTMPKPDYLNLGRGQLLDSLVNLYRTSLILENQLQTLKIKPDEKVPLIRGNLNRLTAKELRQQIEVYYPIALVLTQQIQNQNDLGLEDFRDSLEQKNRKIFELKLKNLTDRLSIKEEYQDQYINMVDSIVSQTLSINKNSVPILTAAVPVYKFLSGSDFVKTDLSLGFDLNINAYPILRFTKIIDFWGSYISPNFTTQTTENLKWNINMYTFGMDLAFNHAIKLFSNSDIGFKLGVGHYWAKGKVYNSGMSDQSWEGDIIRGEANLTYYRQFFPVELFFAYQFFLPSSDINFNDGNKIISYGKSRLDNITLGLRISFWWYPNLPE